MPSRDANGNRIGGAEQQRRAKFKRRAAAEPECVALALLPESGGASLPPHPNPWHGWPAPPIEDGPMAVEAWAARLVARAVIGASLDEGERIAWVIRHVRKLGSMADKARKSWKAARVLNEYEGGLNFPWLLDQPPDDRALAAWAFLRMAEAIHQGAVSAAFEEESPGLNLTIEAAATVGFVGQHEAICLLVAEIRERQEAATPKLSVEQDADAEVEAPDA